MTRTTQKDPISNKQATNTRKYRELTITAGDPRRKPGEHHSACSFVQVTNSLDRVFLISKNTCSAASKSVRAKDAMFRVLL